MDQLEVFKDGRVQGMNRREMARLNNECLDIASYDEAVDMATQAANRSVPREGATWIAGYAAGLIDL